MVRVRKLVLAIAAASALTSGMAHALGLGEVTLRSALNQPLLAEIELLETRDLSVTELLPTLASQEDFSKAGVDRQHFLSDLKFTSVVKPGGKSVILVTSSKPMREPYLNFLVEVLWPNGRLLREYTLLLDPPLYTPQSVIPASPQRPVVSAPAPRIQPPQPVSRPAPQVATGQRPPAAPFVPAPAAAVPPAAKPADRNEYRTTANDTLWEIARSARGNNNVNQAMLAIQDLNPGAFIDGNINRLKSGQVLRLPSDEQIRSRSRQQAVEQVAEQNSAWRERRSVATAARQLDATRRTSAEPAPAQVEQSDNLKLVAADSGKSTVGSESGSADSKALSDKLAVTQESLDSSRRENTELNDRLDDLQSQLDKLQRLMELKDTQLAKLQADLAAKDNAPVAEAAVEAPEPAAALAEKPAEPVAPAEPVVAAVEPAPAAVAETPAEPEAADALDAPQTPAVAEAVEPAPEQTDYNYAEEPVAAAEAAAPAAVEPVPVQAEPAATDAAASEPTVLDKILANPMWLGLAGGAALLALLLTLMIASRRKAAKQAEEQERLGEESGKADELDADMQLPDDSFDGLQDNQQEQSSEPAADERVTAQTTDVLSEADIYIAYGRFPQAAELLENAIKEEPQRSDLRLKLMEVYAEMGEQNRFSAQEQALREQGVAAAEIDQLKAKYPAMGAALLAAGVAAAASTQADELNLDELVFDEPEADLSLTQDVAPAIAEVAPAAMPAELDDAFDLSLEELEAELDRDLQVAAANADLEFDNLSLDSDEFTASLDELQVADFAPDAPLSFDADLAGESEQGLALEPQPELADFSLELDAPAQPAVETQAADDFLLNFEEETVASSAGSAVVEESDFEPLSSNVLGDEFDLSAEFDLASSDEAAEQPSVDSFASQLDKVSMELDVLSESLTQTDAAATDIGSFDELGGDDDFDFLSGTDEATTKLDLARAYIEMGDAEGARDILSEVVNEGNEGQQQEARELIAKLV